MRKFKNIFIYILVIAGLFIVSHKPTANFIRDKVKARVAVFVNQLNHIVDDPTEIETDPTIIHPVILDVLFDSVNQNSYIIEVIFKENIDILKIDSILINETLYPNEAFEYGDGISIYLNDYVTFDELSYYTITLNTIYINELPTKLDYDTYIFKEIDDKVVNNLKKLSVSVKAQNDKEGSWGSGVILKKEKIGFRLYEYYVLTNYHVVKDRSSFVVYIDQGFGSPSAVKGYLVNYSYKKTDLAVLRFSSTSGLLPTLYNNYVLKDLPIVKNQPVFVIGSPGINNANFNSSDQGVIISTLEYVTLKNSTICKDSCKSFKTSITLAGGSSGGGTFDANGNLIGIHFAGREDGKTSNSISMDIILEFIDSFINYYDYSKKEAQINGLFLFYMTS